MDAYVLENYYDVIERLDAFSSVLTVIPGVDFVVISPFCFYHFPNSHFIRNLTVSQTLRKCEVVFWRSTQKIIDFGVVMSSEKRFGPFILERMIGRGGMGAVYRARREDTDEIVAVKALLLPLEQERERFSAEIATMKMRGTTILFGSTASTRRRRALLRNGVRERTKFVDSVKRGVNLLGKKSFISAL